MKRWPTPIDPELEKLRLHNEAMQAEYEKARQSILDEARMVNLRRESSEKLMIWASQEIRRRKRWDKTVWRTKRSWTSKNRSSGFRWAQVIIFFLDYFFFFMSTSRMIQMREIYNLHVTAADNRASQLRVPEQDAARKNAEQVAKDNRLLLEQSQRSLILNSPLVSISALLKLCSEMKKIKDWIRESQTRSLKWRVKILSWRKKTYGEHYRNGIDNSACPLLLIIKIC